jgi:hypothetical protein
MWSEDTWSLFDRMLKVVKEKQKHAEVVSYTEREKKKRIQDTRNRVSLGKKRRTCRLLDDKIQVLPLFSGHGNDDYRNITAAAKCETLITTNAHALTRKGNCLARDTQNTRV